MIGLNTPAVPAVEPAMGSPRLFPLCGAASAMAAGCQAKVDFTAALADKHLGDQAMAYWIEGDMLRIVARSSSKSPPMLMGSFQTPMAPLQNGLEGLWGVQYQLPYMDQSMLDLRLIVDGVQRAKITYRGAKAPQAVRAKKLAGRLEAVNVDSVNLGQKRGVTVYTPAQLPPPEGYAVVYMADDAATVFAPIVEKLILDGQIRPVLLVGMQNGGKARANEYLPGLDTTAYARHEAFVLHEVMPLVEAHFHASQRSEDRLTYGFSNGGAWALAFGTEHPELFHQVSAFAVAGRPDEISVPSEDEKQLFYLGAGAYDFLSIQTAGFCRKIRQTGLPCNYLTLYAGHDQAMWEQGLVYALTGAFPADLSAQNRLP
jgi:enterochelin esterase family protein